MTGGAAGIGAAIVEGFLKEGANIVIADISIDVAQKLADKLRKGNRKVVAVKTNVTNESSAANLVSTTLREFGKIDILVNNAGVSRSIKFRDIDEEEWDRVYDINVKGVYMVTRAVVPHMMAARYGKIINMASVAGKRGISGFSHYCGSKSAVIGITQSLANEVAEYDINVNAVCPGIVHTRLWDGLLDNIMESEGIPHNQRAQIFDERVGQIPLERPQTPEDIANVVVFLSSEVARNITGEAVSVNGGMWMD